MRIFNLIIFLLLTVKSFAFFGGCPPCVCTETVSPVANAKLSVEQIKILTTNINKKLDKTINSTKKLLKNETEKLKKYKKIQMIEKLSALKLKEMAFDVKKKNNLLFLEIKKEINENKNLTILEKEKLLKELKNIYYSK